MKATEELFHQAAIFMETLLRDDKVVNLELGSMFHAGSIPSLVHPLKISDLPDCELVIVIRKID